MGDKKKGKKNRSKDSKNNLPAKKSSEESTTKKDAQSKLSAQELSKTPGSSSSSPRTLIRHYKAPRLNGCRWCGYENKSHGFIWVKSVGNHAYTPPTSDQIKARAIAGSSK